MIKKYLIPLFMMALLHIGYSSVIPPSNNADEIVDAHGDEHDDHTNEDGHDDHGDHDHGHEHDDHEDAHDDNTNEDGHDDHDHVDEHDGHDHADEHDDHIDEGGHDDHSDHDHGNEHDGHDHGDEHDDHTNEDGHDDHDHVDEHDGHDHGDEHDDHTDEGRHDDHSDHDHGHEHDGHDHGDEHDGHTDEGGHDDHGHEHDGHDHGDEHDDHTNEDEHDDHGDEHSDHDHEDGHDDHDHDHDNHGDGHEDHTNEDGHDDHGDHEHDDHGDHEHDDHGGEHADHGDEHDHHGDEHDGHDDHDHGDEHDDHGHDHEHEHNHEKEYFSKLLSELKSTQMTAEVLSELLEKLRETTQCEGDAENICSKCITAVSLLRSANIEGSTLDEHQFERIAWILSYYLKTGENASCTNGGGCLITDTEAKSKMFPGTEICSNHFSSDIVGGMKENTCPEADRCVRNISPFPGECVNVEHLDESGLMTGVLLSIVKCRCELPNKTFFMDEILEYGNADENEVVSFEDFVALLELFKVGGEVEIVDDHSGHNHRRRKREVGHEHEEDHKNSACFTADELLAIYGIDRANGINRTQLSNLSPAILQQIASNVCVAKPGHSFEDPNYTEAMKYGYGTASVLIISLLAFLGLLVFPVIGSSTYKLTMQFFIALGVGTMSGDAILHIIPEAVGLHEHGPGETHSEDEDRTYLWRLLVVVGGIYVFYLFENVVRLWNATRNKKIPLGVHDHDHSLEHGNARTEVHTMTSVPAASTELSNIQNGTEDNKKELEEHESQKVVGEMTSVAIMVLIGDILHNFGDGIAIGVAFSSGWVTGVGTSIAIFCHELPHEFGDFAIYLKNGLSKWKALAANFAAACMAFVGLYIGLAISANPEARKWIMAVIAGMFLYICLVDVLHEMVETKTTKPLLQFILQNFGLLLGWAILLVLAMYEDSLRTVLQK